MYCDDAWGQDVRGWAEWHGFRVVAGYLRGDADPRALLRWRFLREGPPPLRQVAGCYACYCLVCRRFFFVDVDRNGRATPAFRCPFADRAFPHTRCWSETEREELYFAEARQEPGRIYPQMADMIRARLMKPIPRRPRRTGSANR